MLPASLVLLNTCAIRENAEQKVWNRLETLSGMRLGKKATRRSKAMVVGVLGCMAERLKEKLLERERLVDLVCGPDAYRDLPRLVQCVQGGEKAVNVQLSMDETYGKQRIDMELLFSCFIICCFFSLRYSAFLYH